MVLPPAEVGVEEIVANLVLWLKFVIEAIGALVIGIGMVLAALRFTCGTFPPSVRGSAVDAGPVSFCDRVGISAGR
jgi:hypothetical protein